MTKVFLREKKLKHGKHSLYLDFYPPIPHPETRKPTRRAHLDLYIFERPKTETEKTHNKETRLLAEHIRAQRQLEVQAGNYNFLFRYSKNKDFIEYFQRYADARKPKTDGGSASLHRYLIATLNHLKAFAGEPFLFGHLTANFCSDFRDYLLNEAKLARNSAALYFDRFRAVVGQAVKDKLLSENPTKNIKPIQTEETQREFLTLEELQALANTPFRYDAFRRAALFSALTGLRWSDIKKLTWGEIRHGKQHGDYIRFRQKKTKGEETLPISEDARARLGTPGETGELVFQNLGYYQCNYLSEWTKAAGIDREIGFHCFRHTFAVLQITHGTDLYTVSKMLGHKNIKTTEIYAKVIDAKKREAANKIKLK